MINVKWYPIAFIIISLIADGVDYLFICLLTTLVSSLVNWLFIYFFHFQLGYHFLLLTYSSLLVWISILCHLYALQISSSRLRLMWMVFYFLFFVFKLIMYFYMEDFKNFIGVKLINLLLYELCFCDFLKKSFPTWISYSSVLIYKNCQIMCHIWVFISFSTDLCV